MIPKKYGIEAYLRHKHEYYAVCVHGVGVVLYLLAPEFLGLIANAGLAFAAVSFIRLATRFSCGRFVSLYQSGLWRYEKFTIPRKKLPVSTHRNYLGHGFEWTPKYTQRLAQYDAAEDFGRMPKWYSTVKAWREKYENTPWISKLLDKACVDVKLNPLRPAEPPGDNGSVVLHGVGRPEGYYPVSIGDALRTGHLAILGTTGVGKTVLMSQMIRQDIAAGHVVIVLDPKGDAGLLSACYNEVSRANREDEFHCFHLGFPEFSSAYSPIGNFSRITEVASRISGLLPGDGQSLAFREFVWRYVNCVAQTMTALGNKLDIRDIGRFGLDINPLAEDYLAYYLESTNYDGGAAIAHVNAKVEEGRHSRLDALRWYFKNNRIDDDLALSIIYYVEYDRSHLEKLIGSLLPLINKLTTGKTAALLSPDYLDSSRSIFSWPELIRSRGVAYIGFDSMTDAEVSSAVGNAMFADLTSSFGDKYKHGKDVKGVKICIYADEFSELVGDTFVQILNKSRGANVRVTVGAQTVEDLNVGFGSKDKAQQALGNINNIISLRSKNLATAEVLTNQLKKAYVHSTTVISSARDSADVDSPQKFTSSNEQRITKESVDQLDAASMSTLPAGEAFALIGGGKLFKIKVPLIKEEDGFDNDDNDDVASVIDRMREDKNLRWGDTTPIKVAASINAPELLDGFIASSSSVRANIGMPTDRSVH